MLLRYYQEEAVEAIFDYFREKSGNPLVGMPTGTGKSLVIGEFVRRVYQHYPTQRVMMLTHVKELIVQNFEKLLAFWPTAPAGIYSAGLGRKEALYKITFAGIASAAKKAKLFGRIDLVLIDECHLVSAKEDTLYRSFLEELRKTNPYLKVVGFTATPYRLGVGSLTEGGLFTDFCYDLTGMDAFNRLVAEGYLAPLIPRRTDVAYNVEGVRIQGGEFVQKDLQAAVDKDELTYAAVREMVALGSERKHWLIFAAGIEHAEHVASALDSMGIASAVVHSKLPSELRDKIIRDFKASRIRALVNMNVLTTGFDFPAIDLIGVLRPTSSTVLHVQLLGRGTRPAPGKENCLVLDFAGNTRRLGPINDPVLPKPKGSKGGGEAPVRICEACGVYNHASARFCFHCGAEFPRHLKIKKTAYTDELLATGGPKVEVFKVDRIVYSEHRKPGKPSTVQVAYYCGLQMFREWVCLEHAGFARKKAREWWRRRAFTLSEPPETTAEALANLDKLKVPYFVKIWLNKEFPEVIDYAYTADGFRSIADIPRATDSNGHSSQLPQLRQF